jgi:hypothetical protein
MVQFLVKNDRILIPKNSINGTEIYISFGIKSFMYCSKPFQTNYKFVNFKIMKSTRIVATIMMLISMLALDSLNAQDTTFRLSDYKNPNYLYQTLDLNFDLNSGLILNKTNTNSISSDKTFSLNSRAAAIYSRYVNTPKTQTELHTSIDVGFRSSSNRWNRDTINFDGNSANYNHQEAIQFWGIKRLYNAKQNYIEFDGGINTFYQSYNYKSEFFFHDTINTSYEGYQRQFTTDLTGSVIIGKGRIEQVQDARMAMYLLEDLQKLNRQKQVASNEDVLALASEITKLKYKRFFDNRLRKIAEITAIDSFLQKNGIAGTADATYFTSLTDNWNYSNNPVRNSGKRIFTGIEADYYYSKESQSTDYIVPEETSTNSELKRRNAGVFAVVGIAYEKPVSLKWQNSANLKIGFGFRQTSLHIDNNDNVDPLTMYTENFPSVKLSGDYGFGYYPNSRTWLIFDWWILTGWDKEKNGFSKQDKEDLYNRFYTYTGPQFRAYYYLSEKLRLSLAFTGEFRFDNYKYTREVFEGDPEKVSSTWWNQNISAALTYSLF